MKQTIFSCILLFAGINSVHAQTNTFPTTGNVGIGTLTPISTLQVNGDLNGSSSITIGKANSLGNINVPIGASAGGYNIDFYTWRDIIQDQIGARIRAERINTHEENNALVQAMDLSFYTSNGRGQADLSEKMRISHSGNVGIGTTNPKAKLDIVGSIAIQTMLHNQSVRPTVSSNKIPGEIRAYSVTNDGADDGFLRLSAGGGTNSQVLSYIDISSHSTIPDMDKNIVFGTGGTERMRIISSGNVGIGTNSPIDKLSVNGNIRAKEIKVEVANWPDYVFADDYKLPTLQETEKHIKEKGHLEGIPSAKEVTANGIDIGEMNAKLLQKIEELTMYIIKMDKENKEETENNLKQQKLIELQQRDIIYLKSKLN